MKGSDNKLQQATCCTHHAEPVCGLHTHFWNPIFLDVPVIWLSGSVQCALDEMGESFTVSLTWPKIWSKSFKHIMLFQIFSCGNKIRTWLMITRKKFLMTFVFQEWRGKSATRTYIRFTDIDFNLEQKNPNEWAKCYIKVSILQQFRFGVPVVSSTTRWPLSIPASSNQSNTGFPVSLENVKLQIALELYCTISTYIYISELHLCLSIIPVSPQESIFKNGIFKSVIKGILSCKLGPAFMKEAQTAAKVVFIVEGKNKKVKYQSSLAFNAIYTYIRCIYIEGCVYLNTMVSFDTLFPQWRCSKSWHFHAVFVNQVRLCWERNNAHRVSCDLSSH